MTSTRCGAVILAAGAVLILASSLIAGTARADVTVSEKTVFEGFGERGRMASEGTTTLVVSGEKMRQETATRFTGRMMRRSGGEEGMTSTSITRIDRRLTYRIDMRDKAYTVIPFESSKGMEVPPREAGEPERPQVPRRREPPLTCDPVRVESKPTGQKGDVNGFPSEESVVVGTQVCHNEKTQQACTNVYTLDTWTTPLTPRLRELREFNEKMAAAIGIDLVQMQAAARASQGAMPQLGQGFEAVYKELRKAKGFPVRSHVIVEKDGSCDRVGGSERGGRSGRAGGRSAMGDGSKGMRGGKMERDAREAPPTDESTPSGRTRIFGMSTEITSVRASTAPPDVFEPPAGFVMKQPSRREASERTKPPSTK